MTTDIRTSPVALRLDGLVPDVEAALLQPVIQEIDELKRQRNAIVLAHNYMTPDIFHIGLSPGFAFTNRTSVALLSAIASSRGPA